MYNVRVSGNRNIENEYRMEGGADGSERGIVCQ